jgi:tripartite-type tricarboxylate transporter receptor subunit TctC
LRQWLGFALPADTPREVLERITAIFLKAMASKEIKDLAAGQMLTLYGLHGPQADQLVRDMESVWTWMLYDQGIATKSPAEFGIPRPPVAATSGPAGDKSGHP